MFSDERRIEFRALDRKVSNAADVDVIHPNEQMTKRKEGIAALFKKVDDFEATGHHDIAAELRSQVEVIKSIIQDPSISISEKPEAKLALATVQINLLTQTLYDICKSLTDGINTKQELRYALMSFGTFVASLM